jgi:hypothetical protein
VEAGLAPHDEPFASRAGKPHQGRKIGTNRGEDERPGERSPVSGAQEEAPGEDDLDENVRRGDGGDPARELMLLSEEGYTLDIRVRGALVHTRAQRDHRRHVRKDDAAGPNGQQESAPGAAPHHVRHQDRHQHAGGGARVNG